LNLEAFAKITRVVCRHRFVFLSTIGYVAMDAVWGRESSTIVRLQRRSDVPMRTGKCSGLRLPTPCAFRSL
jgi:hypothetical protein